jgi:hypothetical protein
MRRVRPRFKVRTMMILVAFVGVASLGGREVWRRWLRQDYRNPVFPSSVVARVGSNEGMRLAWNPDQPVLVSVTYDFKFGPSKPPPGLACELFAEVWFEEVATGAAVETYTFDALLTAGSRDSASGTFTWEPSLPHPGRYFLRSFLHWKTPTGELRGMNGSGRLYIVGPDNVSSQPRTGATH